MKSTRVLMTLLVGFILHQYACASSSIKDDEVVVFFPTIAYPIDEVWKVHIHGWIYEPEWEISRLFGLESNNKQRMAAFFVDNERGKQISIHFGGQRIALSNKSAKNGHFSDVLLIPAIDIKALRGAQFIPFEAVSRDSRRFVGQIQLVDKNGISVISDIDDTIKISEVRDKKALLANTFIHPFQPVPDMATLYKSWQKRGNVTFHYVSASPWQLYQPLANFLKDNGFPMGSFHLRLFRWKDSSFFDFFKSSRPHKIKTIKSLIDCCMERRFILVGDSGENDPEIYAEIARQYPQQISRIFIHDVTGDEAARYQKTFKGLPKSLWQVFQDAATLE